MIRKVTSATDDQKATRLVLECEHALRVFLYRGLYAYWASSQAVFYFNCRECP